MLWVSFTLTLLIVAVLTALLVVVVLQRETYEDRLFYYTGYAGDVMPGTHSLQELHEAHPHEFSLDSLEKYHVLDFPKCEALFQDRGSRTLPFPVSYVEDLYGTWKLLGKRYKTPGRFLVWYPHDRVERFDFPILVKSRSISPSENATGSVLFRLNSARHFGLRLSHVVQNRDKEAAFRDKTPRVVWRGAPTGYGFGNNIPFRSVSRQTLIEKYYGFPSPLIDVGLVLVTKPEHAPWKKYQKDEMSLDTLLSYKYLLSVEGNDVATNLKWALASNSLVLMPRPQVSSWFMEDALLPYVHYLPVRDDFDDLERQVEWAERNPGKCEEMIANAHQYVEPFLDVKKERKLQMSVLRYYLDRFQWKA